MGPSSFHANVNKGLSCCSRSTHGTRSAWSYDTLIATLQVDFNLGYSLPLSSFVKRAGGLLRLRMPFGPPFDDVWVEEMVVRVSKWCKCD